MKKHTLALFALFLCFALMLTGCGGAARTENAAADFAPAEPQYDSAASTHGASAADGIFESASTRGLKMVYNASMTVETKTFDESRAAILGAVQEAGGYVSASESWGGWSAYDNSYSSRSVYLTLRIPADAYADFLAAGDTFGSVTGLRETSEDITAAYIDTESRLSSLRAQETRLLELMDKAATVEEVIAIQDMLTDVVYEIESLTSTLNTYDNLVAFCTVDISLHEVSTITVHRTSFGGRLWETLKDSLRSILSLGEGLVTALVFLIPYALIALPLFLGARHLVRKRRAKRAALTAENAPAEE